MPITTQNAVKPRSIFILASVYDWRRWMIVGVNEEETY